MTAELKFGEKQGISADQIVSLLAARHSEDVFVPECKDGPTQQQGANMVRMDAWAMPRSWARPWSWAYEVKVSRGDFLADEKWPRYLPLCHRFYFVAPAGVIQPEELPAEAGLLLVSRNAKKLMTKKKAPIRTDVVIPEGLWRYIMMTRVAIRDGQEMDGAEYWENWLAKRKDDEDLGYRVGREIRETVRRVESENRRLRLQHEDYLGWRKLMDDMGITRQAWMDGASRRRELAKALACDLPDDLGESIDRAIDRLEIARRRIAAFEEENG